MYRVNLASIVLSGVCLGFLFVIADGLSACHAQDNQKASSKHRSLRFPSDQSVGVLRVGRLKGPNVVMDFEQTSGIAAKGNVEVSEDDFVELQVGSVDDLEFLEQLSPGALQGLQVTGLQIDRKSLSFITRLDGLQNLRFERCEFKEDAFDGAKKLSFLQAISINSESKSSPTFAGWIATMPKLAYLYARPSLDAREYLKLSGHPSLATTTIDIGIDQSQWPLEQLRLPALRELIVHCDENASPRALDAISSLSKLESITISSGTVDGDLLKKIGGLGNVRKLRLIYNKMGSRFLEGLESLQSLEHLDFNPLNLDGTNLSFFYGQLAGSVLKLPRIKTIPKIRKPNLQTLQQIIARTTMESLDIEGWDVGVPMAKLQELSALKGLKSLSLSFVRITDDELQYLSKLEGLEKLSLVQTDVSGIGLRHLSDLPKLREMQIMMDAEKLTPELSGLTYLKGLERLQLFGLGFKPEHFFPVAECRSLRDVALSEGEIEDSLVTRLAGLPSLVRVNLGESSMTDVGARAMARNQNLESVFLGGKISRDAVIEFAKLPKLSRIYIRSSKLDPVDCVDLQFEFPSVGSIGFSRNER